MRAAVPAQCPTQYRSASPIDSAILSELNGNLMARRRQLLWAKPGLSRLWAKPGLSPAVVGLCSAWVRGIDVDEKMHAFSTGQCA